MSEDIIKRSDAIKAMEQRYQDILRIFKRKVKDGEKAITLDMIGCIKSLPSADRPQGEWKHFGGDEWLCSNCGHVVYTEGSWEHPLEREKDYCEHCGAKMFAKGINVPNKKGADDE